MLIDHVVPQIRECLYLQVDVAYCPLKQVHPTFHPVQLSNVDNTYATYCPAWWLRLGWSGYSRSYLVNLHYQVQILLPLSNRLCPCWDNFSHQTEVASNPLAIQSTVLFLAYISSLLLGRTYTWSTHCAQYPHPCIWNTLYVAPPILVTCPTSDTYEFDQRQIPLVQWCPCFWECRQRNTWGLGESCLGNDWCGETRPTELPLGGTQRKRDGHFSISVNIQCSTATAHVRRSDSRDSACYAIHSRNRYPFPSATEIVERRADRWPWCIHRLTQQDRHQCRVGD